MTGADFIKGQLALLAWRDGFSEGLDGMRAVAFAIRNRQQAGWFGGDWIALLANHKKYSARIEPYDDILPDPRVYSFQCLLHEIDGIFAGGTRDDVTVPMQSVLARPTNPVLYYAKLNEISSDWFLTEISRRPELHPRTAQVGALTFFS